MESLLETGHLKTGDSVKKSLKCGMSSVMAWMIAPSQWTLSQHSADAREIRL